MVYPHLANAAQLVNDSVPSESGVLQVRGDFAIELHHTLERKQNLNSARLAKPGINSGSHITHCSHYCARQEAADLISDRDLI